MNGKNDHAAIQERIERAARHHRMRHAALELYDVLREYFDYRGDECVDSCASQPRWLSGAPEQGECDCMVGRAKKLFTLIDTPSG